VLKQHVQGTVGRDLGKAFGHKAYTGINEFSHIKNYAKTTIFELKRSACSEMPSKVIGPRKGIFVNIRYNRKQYIGEVQPPPDR
jgi:hypothetical protein